MRSLMCSGAAFAATAQTADPRFAELSTGRPQSANRGGANRGWGSGI